MAQAVKTIEYAIGTLTATLATNTTLGTATENDFADVTVETPESTRTIRSVMIEVTARGAEPTTKRRLDGVRIGVQVDAVAFSDLDVTGTGIAATGDEYSFHALRDVTSYFVTNFTGTSHAIGVRVRFEHDVADVVNNITVKLILTYEYDDASATQIKTVRIPMEGLTGFLTTTANTDFRGATGAAQIPLLDTFLPESTKTYKNIWFEVEATDAGAAVTDFNANYSIDAGATATRSTLEMGANTSCRFFDIWVQNSMTTNAGHDFEAWSSLASRFERMICTLYVTYTFDAANSTTIINSLLLPIPTDAATIMSTAAADQDVWEVPFWIQEPATITLVQSALRLYYYPAGATNITVAVNGEGAAGGTQGTTSSLYTATALVSGGSFMLQHRIDTAHGGSAVTLGRGRNVLVVSAFQSVAGQATAVNGFFILNYTSGKSTAGLGSHNQTTRWCIEAMMDTAIAGNANREIPTTNQRTPNIPQTDFYINSHSIRHDSNGSAGGANAMLAERLASEGQADGWEQIGTQIAVSDAEFGWQTYGYGKGGLNGVFLKYPSDPLIHDAILNIETARKYRMYGSQLMHSSFQTWLTVHAITYTVSGEIRGSGGGTVNIYLQNASTGEVLKRTTRSGNGSFSFTWFENINDLIVVAYETDTLKGASRQAVAGTAGFDIWLGRLPQAGFQLGI